LKGNAVLSVKPNEIYIKIFTSNGNWNKIPPCWVKEPKFFEKILKKPSPKRGCP